jgi:hypothetical protein
MQANGSLNHPGEWDDGPVWPCNWHSANTSLYWMNHLPVWIMTRHWELVHLRQTVNTAFVRISHDYEIAKVVMDDTKTSNNVIVQ